MINVLREVFAGVAIITLVVFAMQNLAMVDVNFLTWSTTMPRSLMLGVVFIVGAITGYSIRQRQFALGKRKKRISPEE